MSSLFSLPVVSSLLLGGFVFVMLFGQSTTLRDSWVGSAHHLLTETLPQRLDAALRKILGTTGMAFCSRYVGWIANDKHPLVQFFYLFLITGGLIVHILSVVPRIPNPYCAEYHIYASGIVIISTYIIFAKASVSNPGFIRTHNVDKVLAAYDYDFWIYEPKICGTCSIDKPARSKHCSVCKGCVAKLDHHCVWINNCVGHYNHRWFLLFLLSSAMYCCYGAFMSGQVLRSEYDVRRIAEIYVRDPVTRSPKLMPWTTQILYLTHSEPVLTGLFLIESICGLLLIVFFGYQLSMVLSGKTTNETFKWEDLDYAIRKGQVPVVDGAVFAYNQEYKPLKRRIAAGGRDGKLAARRLARDMNAIAARYQDAPGYESTPSPDSDTPGSTDDASHVRLRKAAAAKAAKASSPADWHAHTDACLNSNDDDDDDDGGGDEQEDTHAGTVEYEPVALIDSNGRLTANRLANNYDFGPWANLMAVLFPAPLDD